MAACIISGTITAIDGTPVVEAEVRLAVVPTADDQSGQIASSVGVTSDSVSAFTDNAGAFSITGIQGVKAILEIPVINLRKQITVPTAAGPVDFTTLI